MSETNKPLVTIGIPTYNRADGYLKGALESALAQEYHNLEIIVSDNNSSDNTEELVKSYKDSRIQYVKHQKNIGANNNFNYCLENGLGDYFLLLHDDDLIDPDFIDMCMNSVQYRSDVGVIRTGVRVIDKNGVKKRSKNNSVQADSVEEFVEQWMNFRKTSVYLCSVLFHRKGLIEIGGFKTPKNLYIDVVAEIKLTAEMGRKDIYPIKASFRRHEGNNGDAQTIYDWAIDTNYVIDVIKENISNDQVINNAKLKLYNWNYHRANRISSFLHRWYSFFINYRLSGFKHSPFIFIYNKDIKSKLSKLQI